MRIRCRQCGLDIDVPPRTEGSRLRCPECQFEFICALPRAVEVDQPPAAGSEEIILVEEVDAAGPFEAADAGAPSADSPADALAAAAARSADEAPAETHGDAPAEVVCESPRKWYVMVGGAAAVALTFSELRQRAAAGQITPRTKLWYAPKDVHLSARDVPGLFPETDARRTAPAKPTPPRPTGKTVADADSLSKALDSLAAEAGEGEKESDAP
jgi:hypothetical protein